MEQTLALVNRVVPNGPLIEIGLDAPGIGPKLAPGCFVLADCGEYLRRPLFPARLTSDGFDVLVSPDDKLASWGVGDTLDIIGPLGHGFAVPESSRRLLLVADVIHLPALLPLVWQPLGEAGGSAISITLLLSAPTAEALYPVRLLPPALEVHLVTGDGSIGHPGELVDLFPELVRWADCICVACDPAAYPALADIVREVRLVPGERFAQALVVPPIACGVGACQGCALPVARGYRLACTDGPVFDLLELR